MTIVAIKIPIPRRAKTIFKLMWNLSFEARESKKRHIRPRKRGVPSTNRIIKESRKEEKSILFSKYVSDIL